MFQELAPLPTYIETVAQMVENIKCITLFTHLLILGNGCTMILAVC